MDLRIENKIVLITGSTLGIGFGIAKNFALAGAKVLVNGRKEDAVNKAVEELIKIQTEAKLQLTEGNKPVGVVGDVSTSEGADEVIKAAEKIGPLYALINNVGIFGPQKFETISDEEWLRFLNVNLMSAVRLSRYYLPQMLQRNEGRILMIEFKRTSTDEKQVKWPYVLSQRWFTTRLPKVRWWDWEGLAELTKGSHVTVNSVLVGPTRTEGLEEFLEKLAKEHGTDKETASREYFSKNETTSLLQRFLSTDEVGQTVLFLASHGASGINGHAQRVEGGIIRHI